jgi:hypothetical protein
MHDVISVGYLNGLFVLARSIGFIGHALDQKRLQQPLYRHPWEDVLCEWLGELGFVGHRVVFLRLWSEVWSRCLQRQVGMLRKRLSFSIQSLLRHHTRYAHRY